MTPQPTLTTRRLVLRPFGVQDSAPLSTLAGRREIADTMISIPHPFSVAQAAAWLGRHGTDWQEGRAAHWAIRLDQGALFVGAIELRAIDREHCSAEVSFWIRADFWGQGYASEALPAVVDFAFSTCRLNRLVAHHMVRNHASGRVLEKAGFQAEGLLRECVRKWGRFEDVVLRARLRRDRPPCATRPCRTPAGQGPASTP